MVKIKNTILAKHLQIGDFIVVNKKNIRIVSVWTTSKTVMIKLYNGQIISRNETDEVKILCK